MGCNGIPVAVQAALGGFISHSAWHLKTYQFSMKMKICCVFVLCLRDCINDVTTFHSLKFMLVC